MGSFILFMIGVAAPLAVALTVMWNEDRRRSFIKMRMERLAQDNRGLKLAMGSKPAAAELPAQSEAERKEIVELSGKLAQGGILLEWLRLGTKAPEEAAARLLGVNAQEAAQMQELVAEWGVEGIALALDRLKSRLSSITEMEMAWADPHALSAQDTGAMAEKALWVFEPEYVVNQGDFEVDSRLGAVAKPSVSAGLQNGSHKEGDPTLVVELKGARVTVGGEQQMQAWNNVRDLMRTGAIRERDPVDVFVIGGSVDEYEGNPRIEGRHRNVKITSYDYGQLITRAKRLTFGLYDELKDAAPFIRHQRQEISDAQQAAANEAAVQASASVQPEEEEQFVREDEAGVESSVRDVEYADDPVRDVDDGDAQHKEAAQ